MGFEIVHENGRSLELDWEESTRHAKELASI